MNDVINRKDAIGAILSVGHIAELSDGDAVIRVSAVNYVLRNLPSAQPERKKGEWIYNSPVTMKCDQCGLVIKDWDWHRFKICPNCGADMRGEKDG